MKTRLIALLLPAALAVAILTGCIAASAEQLDAPVQAREPAVTADADVPRTANEPNSTQETAPAAVTQRITAQEAEAIALKHAGVAAEDVRYLRNEFDYDDGIPEYDIEFHMEGLEYEYEIHAESGAILRSHIEREPIPAAPAPQPAATEPASAQLTKEEAIAIALKHAGLAKDQVSRLKAEFDYDDGVPEYDVDFYCDGMEYDYEIHAESGKLLSWDKDRDD